MSGCGAGPATAPDPADSTPITSSADRFAAQLPAGWEQAAEPLTSVDVPREIFAAGTFPLEPGGSCGPRTALDDMGPTDALVSIQEIVSEKFPDINDDPHHRDDFPPRPEAVKLNPKPTSCFGHEGLNSTWVLFEDAGRRFFGALVLGKAATPETEREALALFDSFTFESRMAGSKDAAYVERWLSDHSGQPGGRATCDGTGTGTFDCDYVFDNPERDVTWKISVRSDAHGIWIANCSFPPRPTFRCQGNFDRRARGRAAN